MCGIAGVAFRNPQERPDPRMICGMRDALAHRGPDDKGSYTGPGAALGSRRLAILDLSPNGHMPIETEDGRYSIVYNGEVYNYRELRAALEKQGEKFRSNTDTEVVLRLFVREGPAMLAKLNGMFAFAIWDSSGKQMFLARDRVGVKPLFYSEQPDGLYFASEESALAAAGVPLEFDEDTWPELLCFKYVAGDRTALKGVRKLLPGHYLTWRAGEVSIRRWWRLNEFARAGNSPRDDREWFGTTFDNAIDLIRISDVPVGVLLSGGLDSGSVAASLAEQSTAPVSSFTVRFSDSRYDEGHLARSVANEWKLNYHDLFLSDRDLPRLLEEATGFHGAPLAHASDICVLSIARYARRHVTVLLSGEGGDETLGGYVRYQPLRHPALLNLARPLVRKLGGSFETGRLGKLRRFFELPSLRDWVLWNSADMLPDELARIWRKPVSAFEYREQMVDEALAAYPGEPVRQAMYNDHHTFLQSVLDRNDRMTMAASIECRVPFLDHRLIETLAAMPTRKLFGGGSIPFQGRPKDLLRRTAARRLPGDVLGHRKWGFGVPWADYLRNVPELRSMVEELPRVDRLRESPLDQAALKESVAAFLNGDNRPEPLVRGLLMLSVWFRTLAKPALSKTAVLA